MRLEPLPHGLPDGPIIRLFGFTTDEARQLQDAFHQLGAGHVESVAIHDLSFVEAVGDIRLTCRASTWDRSLFRGPLPGEFECSLTPETWDNVAGLIEPFAEDGAAGFQWLAGGFGGASLLLSVDGRW